MGLVCRGRVLAVEVGFLPVLDTTRQDWLGKERALTALQSNGSTFEEWAARVLGLGIAIEEFQKEVQIRLDLEVILTKGDEVGEIQDGIGGEVMNSELIEVEELAKEEIAGGVKPRNKCSPKMTTSPAGARESMFHRRM